MCLFRRRKQDRIARDIAAQHDLLPDYHAARRQGLSPLEALAEWDLLSKDNLKLLNKK